MWDALMDHFSRHPAQEKVVLLMIRHGIGLDPGPPPRFRAGPVELADLAVARAAGVDRRVVRATAVAIAAEPRLRDVLRQLRPALDLRDVAPHMGWGVVEITPHDPNAVGILAGVAKVIADAGLSVRQAIGEDPSFAHEPRLAVVTQSRIPGSIIPLLQRVPGVKAVTVA